MTGGCGPLYGREQSDRPAMANIDLDPAMRITVFQHVRKLCEAHNDLSARELKPFFLFQGERIPSINR